MTTLMKQVQNATTGEVEIVPLTEAEVAEYEAQQIEWQTIKAEREAELQRVEALKESARAKLAAGEPLTAEEAALIIP